MKKRIIALLLLLVIALSACASEPVLERPGKDPNAIRPTRETKASVPTETTAPTETTEASEAVTDAPTEATEALPDAEVSDVDLGAVSGSEYRNNLLGLFASFPDSWYLYNETDLASLNKLVLSSFDRAAIIDAIEDGQDIVVFCASEPATLSSLKISAAKNPLPGKDADALVNYFAPQLREEYENSGSLQNVACVPYDADFCGAEHVVLAVTGEASGMQFGETFLYLPCGELLYTLTVSTVEESMIAETLGLFEALK